MTQTVTPATFSGAGSLHNVIVLFPVLICTLSNTSRNLYNACRLVVKLFDQFVTLPFQRLRHSSDTGHRDLPSVFVAHLDN